MVRCLVSAVALLVWASAAAQSYTGTFTAINPQGGTVKLTLRYDGPKQVKGTLSGNNNTFQVGGEVTPEGLMGAVTGPQGSLYLMARHEGANLIVFLAEPGPNGEPNLQSARRLVFTKAGAAQSPASGDDAELSQFLTRNAWCGVTSNERIVFYSNGMMSQTSGQQGRWKVANAMLYLSQDGVNWQPQQLSIAQHSSGYRSFRSGGKEYIVCR